MSVLKPEPVRCRWIVETDIDALVPLLARLFPSQPAPVWRRVFE